MKLTAVEVRDPNVLGDFVLGDKLGEGGFGTVYLAEQRTLGRAAVVKVIRKSLVAHRDAADRFALEARLASRFDHPYAAHVYAFGTEPDGSMWIAMELVKGTPLNELVDRGGPIPLERFVPLMERLCDVVQAAHEQQIVHRDIKPSNVMVIARAGRLMPKLLDFGIAKALTTDDEPPLLSLSTRIRAKHPSIGKLGLEHTMEASASDPARATRAPDIATDVTEGSASPPGTLAVSGSLTRAGQILGSPPYMAPEQWADAGRVGPWTDQYALALLAYEAIVGKRAFVGTSLETFREAHATAPLPALPRHLPPKLHAVLARATAKDPTQRFESLTELGRAFREAAQGTAAVDEGPAIALPPALRALWMDRAPAPIAEAIAMLATARTPGRVIDRARGTAALLARWIGVVALACQSRLGRLVPGTPTHELVLATRRRALRDVEWLDLAAAVTQPMIARPEAWPIPELASFAHDAGIATLRSLLEDDRAGAADGIDRAIAEDSLAKLARVLEGASWMLEYSLARAVERGLELWTGVAGEERAVRPASGRTLGEIVVLDADGAPVVRLSPLVQIAAPLPEHAQEVFVFAGPGRDPQASRAVAYPRGFERDDHETWDWFASHLLEDDAKRSISLDDERAPYPGLAAFTGDDHASFVGREAEVEELVNRLREQHLVAVVGASGVGKSSFLAAGVIPVLPGGWRAVTFRPGATPIDALRGALGGADAPYRDGPHRELPDDPTTLADAIAALAGRAGSTLVVVVDQAEELFTMCAAEAERERFATVLTAIAESARIRVVLSLRDDFLYALDALAAWRGRLARSVHVLRMPGAQDLERAIAIPARRCGYDFDDATLPAAIVAEVADQPGALPLIAFAAAELWQRRDRHFKRLTRAAYTEIGGVGGALVQYADGVVDRLPAGDQRLVRLAFRRLLTAEGTRASIGRAELVASLGGDGERVIERLLAARLCVSRDDESGDRIEIIHESLATTWPRLATWRHEDAASTKLHERLAAAARHWDERGRPASLLWRGAVLEELRREDSARSTIEQAFATESVRVARRARKRTIAAVVGAFALLATGTVGLAWANRRISTQKQHALERLAASFEQQGRLAMEDGDAPRAALFLTESRRLGARGPGGDLLIAHAAAALEAEIARIGHTDSPIYQAQFEHGAILAIGTDGTLRRWRDGKATLLAEHVAEAAETRDTVVALDKDGSIAGYSPDGKRRWRVESAVAGQAARLTASATSGLVITYGGTPKLWSSDGVARAELEAGGPVDAAAFDASGTVLALGERSGKVSIFDAATGSVLASCEPHAAAVSWMHFTPDRKLLVTGSFNREVRVCDRTTGALKHRLLGHRNKITALTGSRDGRYIASGSRDGGVYIWDLETGLAQTSFSLGSAVKSLELSADGRQLATSARDGSVRLWDRDSGAALGSLQGHASMVSQLHWEGAQLVTTSMDGSLRKWDVARAARATLASHGASIINFDLAGDLAVTSGADGRAIVWNQLSQRPVATLSHGAALQYAVLSPDLKTVATVDVNGVATLWSVAEQHRVATLATDGVRVAQFLPDGSVATSDERGVLRFWRADGHAAGQLALGFPAAVLTLDPSGRWLAASPDFSETGEHVIIDVASRRIATKLAAEARNLVAFSRDRLALGRGPAIELFELGTWKPLGNLAGHQGNVGGLWFLPDGRLLSSGDDARLLAWSRGGRQTVVNSGDVILDVTTSPDGALVAAIGYEGTLRVFETATLGRLLALPAHRGFSAHLRFIRDGSRVLSAGNDGRLVSWDLQHPTRSLAELATLVRCRVPLALDGDVAVPRKLDLDDPSCR